MAVEEVVDVDEFGRLSGAVLGGGEGRKVMEEEVRWWRKRLAEKKIGSGERRNHNTNSSHYNTTNSPTKPS